MKDVGSRGWDLRESSDKRDETMAGNRSICNGKHYCLGILVNMRIFKWIYFIKKVMGILIGYFMTYLQH